MNMKLQQNSLTQQFVHSLTDAIVRGQFKTGESIPSEGEIAAMFGISRTIVREGIREISSLGLIIKHQGARSVVAPMKDWDMLNKHLLSTLLGVDEKRQEIIEGLFSFRLALECQAATEAAKHRTDADLENMQAQLTVMKQSINNSEQFLEADSQMHRAIHEASHNIVFLSILKNIRDIMAIARDFSIAQPRQQQHAMQQHREIVNLIKDRNPDGANIAMRRHILWAKEGSQAMQL